MSNLALIIVDDFYDDPESIRQHALSLQFGRRKDARYPGKEAFSSSYIWDDVIKIIQSFIPEPSFAKGKSFDYPQGKFHLATIQDQQARSVIVHTDIPLWSAVVYLSKEYDPRGGTQWFRHKPTGALKDTSEFLEYCFSGIDKKQQDEIRKAVIENSHDMTQWEQIQSVDMRYNRLVIFRADNFHANSFLFGDNPKNGRLTQHFVFWDASQLN